MRQDPAGPQPRNAKVIVGALGSILLLAGLAGWYAVRTSPVADGGKDIAHSAEQARFFFIPTPNTDVPGGPVYPYSVIPGGVASARELAARIAEDRVVAKHYPGFNVSRARHVRASRDKLVYVAYRVHDRVFWTKNRLMIRKGEELITDGTNYVRARCGNRIADSAVPRTSSLEPSLAELNPPVPPSASPPDALSLDAPWTSFSPRPAIVAPVPLTAPPTIGGSYSPTVVAPYGTPSVTIPNSGGRPLETRLPSSPESPPPRRPDPPPNPASNVPAIPEPSSIWLAGIGAACALFLLWRNRRKG